MERNSNLSTRSVPTFHEASFRDRQARVLDANGRILRVLDAKANSHWQRVSKEEFFRNHVELGHIVESWEVEHGIESQRWVITLEHARIPVVSYAYEWCFGMLKDAALLHLELLESAIEHNYTIKDSSHFNIQWWGPRPVFIDVASFELQPEGQPWAGYKQFCEMFLFPLMLRAYRGLQFQTLLKGSLEGIPLKEMNRLCSFRDRFRPGVLKHVWLQSRFHDRFANSRIETKTALAQAGFRKEFILINVRSLKTLVLGLEAQTEKTVWLNYAEDNSYAANETNAKKEAVERFFSERKGGLVWDLGSNTGVFSEIAAKHSQYVLSIDSDPEAIERLYRRLPKNSNILPLIMNLADPSPAIGFNNSERKTFSARSKPTSILALALVHHIVIGANVPLESFVESLAAQGGDLLIEFVSKEDEMVKRLLENKQDNYEDYCESTLEASLGRWYSIEQKTPLKGGKRMLYACRRLQDSAKERGIEMS